MTHIVVYTIGHWWRQRKYTDELMRFIYEVNRLTTLPGRYLSANPTAVPESTLFSEEEEEEKEDASSLTSHEISFAEYPPWPS